MKVTLEISEADLAAIWSDTWEDKDERSMEGRLQDALHENASRFRQAFVSYPAEKQLERYRASPHRVTPPPDDIRCPTCAEPVKAVFDHIDQDCEHS